MAPATIIVADIFISLQSFARVIERSNTSYDRAVATDTDIVVVANF